MPNRIIKDSIRTSRSVNAMSDFQFRLWVYLITYVDDYGRGSADPELLKGFVFPRRKGVSEQTIAKTLAELATIGSIRLYDVSGESYFCFPDWSKHQRVQQKRSLFPEPPEDTACHGESPLSTVGHGDSPSEYNPIQYNQNPNTESESEYESKSESNPRGRAKSAQRPDVFAEFSAENQELLTALRGFEEMRKSIKKPMTDRAKRMILSELSKLSQDPAVQAAILDQSTLHNWQGVFALKTQDKGRGGRETGNVFLQMLEEEHT